MIDENEKIIYQKKHPCELMSFLKVLSPYDSDLQGIAIESTYNWYWLVDGLMDHHQYPEHPSKFSVLNHSDIQKNDAITMISNPGKKIILPQQK